MKKAGTDYRKASPETVYERKKVELRLRWKGVDLPTVRDRYADSDGGRVAAAVGTDRTEAGKAGGEPKAGAGGGMAEGGISGHTRGGKG